MKYIPLLLLCLGLSNGLRSQELDHATQNSLFSSYSAVEKGANGNWYVAGYYQQSYWSFPPFLREVAPDGQIINEWTFSAGGDELKIINDIVAQPDGSLLLIGWGGVCDVWGPTGFIYSFENGVIQSQHSYPSLGLAHAVQNDSLTVIAATSGLLFTDLAGDSLRWTPFPQYELPYRVCRTDEGFVGMGGFGARNVLPDGTMTDSLMDVSMDDMIQMPGGALLALTMDSLLELTSDLQRTGNGVRIIDYFGRRRVAYAGGAVRVHTKDTLFSFTPQLVQLSAIPTGHPWAFNGFDPLGYWAGPIEFTDEMVITAGWYVTGAYGAAFRTFPLDVPSTELETDAELKDMTIDSISSTITSSSASGVVTVSAWLHNSGDALLTSVTLNYIVDWICGQGGYSQSYDTLALNPGDSVQLELGPFNFYEEFWQPAPQWDLCIWAARPNYRVDRDPVNNEACALIDFTTGMSASGSKSPLFFPNPATDHVMLRPNLPQHGSFDVTFLDLQGRIALKRSMNYTGELLRIGIEDIKPGVYIVEIAQAGHRSSHRLVVE